jgi:nuclear GTP-binding protein
MAWDDLFPKAGSSKQASAQKGEDSDDGGLDADLGSDEELDSEDDEELVDGEEEEEDDEEDEEEVVEPVVSAKQKGKRGRSSFRDQSIFPRLTLNYIFSAAVTELDDDESKRPTKAPRMTTNKQKSTNYYTTANVKNRNRERKVPKSNAGKVERPKAKDEGKKRMRRS